MQGIIISMWKACVMEMRGAEEAQPLHLRCLCRNMSQEENGSLFCSPVGKVADEAEEILASDSCACLIATGNDGLFPVQHSPSFPGCLEEQPQSSKSTDADRPVPISAHVQSCSSNTPSRQLAPTAPKRRNFLSAHGIANTSSTPSKQMHPSSSSKDQNSTTEGKKDHTSIATDAVHPAAEEEPTFSRESCAIRTKDLYYWCAISGVLLILQVIGEVSHGKFQVVPHLSVFCGLVLLLYSVASAATIYFVNLARPYAAYLLAIGSVLMTGQTAWHFDSFVAHFKSEILLELPSLQNTVLPNFAFGASPIDFLDTATLFVILFENCVQSSCLIRLGVQVTAIVSVVQWVVIACWPLVSPNSYPAWFCRIAATGLWTAHLIWSSYVWESDLKRQWQLVDDLRQSVADISKDLQDRQDADSVLNHLLKNTMADAGGCIDMFQQRTAETVAMRDRALLSKAADFLFRGMWWCKLREGMLRMVAGRYETELVPTNLQGITQDLTRGREIEHECPPVAVELDPMVCNVVLDNAMTNAKRHGCPRDPQVSLTVKVTPEDDELLDEGARVKVRFLVSNRVNPKRPAIQTRWSSAREGHRISVASRKDPLRPTLSDGLGLQHIGMAARASGMTAELWQEGDVVFFELCFSSVATLADPGDAAAGQAACPFPPGLTILGLDDSDVARVTLGTNLQDVVPNGTILMYGKDADEVEEFKQAALQSADILILDENVDVPGAELYGSAILKELIQKGYNGFACIRSGNSDPSAQALSARSGAHWHVGKEVPMRQMIRDLQTQYAKFQEQKAVPPEDDALDLVGPRCMSRVTFASVSRNASQTWPKNLGLVPTDWATSSSKESSSAFSERFHPIAPGHGPLGLVSFGSSSSKGGSSGRRSSACTIHKALSGGASSRSGGASSSGRGAGSVYDVSSPDGPQSLASPQR